MIQKILVSQPKPSTEKNPYTEIEKKYGVEIVFRPLIKVEPVTTREFRDQKVQILNYSAIVFTSKNSIDYFFRMCKETRVKVPDEMKYFVISETISYYIQKYVQYRKRKVFCGKNGKWDDLLSIILKHKNEKFLIPQNEHHNDEIARDMEAYNLCHKECIMFRTVSVPLEKEELSTLDMVVLFTANGVETLKASCGTMPQGKLRIATFGGSAATAVEDAGMHLDLIAPTPKAPSMSAALDLYISDERNGKLGKSTWGRPVPKKSANGKGDDAVTLAEKTALQRAAEALRKEEERKAAALRAKRSEAAKRGAETKRLKALQKTEEERRAAELRKKRSEAAKRGAETKRLKRLQAEAMQ